MEKRKQARKQERSSRALVAGAGMLGIALAGVWLAQTQQPYPNVRVVKVQPAVTPQQGAGQKAFVDPATGQFREPTAEEEQALSAQGGLAAGADSAPVEIGAEGEGIRVVVPADLQTSVAAVKNADGSISFVHTQGTGNVPSSTASSRKEPANDR
jgi:hypothetical protein